MTELITSDDLEDVKGMIDVSAKLVSTTTLNGTASLSVSVSYDYCVIKSITYNNIYLNSSTSSIMYRSELTTVSLDGTAYLNTLVANTSSGIVWVPSTEKVTVSASTIKFSKNVYQITVEFYKYQ